MTDSRRDTASILVRAPREAVADAFRSADAWSEWLPPGGMTGRMLAFEPRAGGAYRIELTYGDLRVAGAGKTSELTDVVEGVFLEFSPAGRIVQTAKFDAGDPAFGGEMKLTWTLEKVAAGTRVTIVAEQVPPGIAQDDHEAGLASTLANLARFVEARSQG